MPQSSIDHRALRLLSFAYASAIVVMLILLIVAQGLIQWTLVREIHLRGVAAQITAQEVRTQHMFYNAILLQNPTGHSVNYNAIAALVEADEPSWAATQDAMYAGSATLDISPGDFDQAAQVVLAHERAGYLVMRAAYTRVLTLEEAAHPASPDAVRADISRIYLQEGPYLESLIALYNDHVSSADALLNLVRAIEISLFAGSLLIIVFEVVFVVRPALRQLREHLLVLAQVLDSKKDGGS